MVRIVGVQRSEDVKGEFVLIQNQGSMRASLRGHAILAEVALENPLFRDSLYVFQDSADLMPGQFALLRTCSGKPKWNTTPEGQHIYSVYMGRTERVWSVCEGSFMVLAPQHTYAERTSEPLAV